MKQHHNSTLWTKTIGTCTFTLLIWPLLLISPLDKAAHASTSTVQKTFSPTMHQLEHHAKSMAGKAIVDIDIFLDKLLAPAHNDHEKAWLIYSWATRHFRYDSNVAAKLGSTNNQELEQLINKRRGSCAVYAHATTQLLQKAGLTAQTIIGKAQTGTGNARHVWTQVHLDGQWWTMDSTWGAGYVDDQGFVAAPNTDFFLIPAEHSVLLYHDPKDRLGTQQQMGMGATQFNRLPDGALTLINLGFNSAQVLHTAKKGTALADTFDQASGTFTVQSAPLTRQLRANKTVSFSLKSRHYQELAVVQNEDWQMMEGIKTPQGLQYHLRTTPKRGDLLLMGRKAGSQNFEALLAYVVQ